MWRPGPPRAGPSAAALGPPPSRPSTGPARSSARPAAAAWRSSPAPDAPSRAQTPSPCASTSERGGRRQIGRALKYDLLEEGSNCAN